VVALLDALLAAHLVEQTDAGHQRPVVQLSDQGTLVMRGHATTDGLMLPGDLVARIKRLAAKRGPAAQSGPSAHSGPVAQSGPVAPQPEARRAASRPAAAPPPYGWIGEDDAAEPGDWAEAATTATEASVERDRPVAFDARPRGASPAPHVLGQPPTPEPAAVPAAGANAESHPPHYWTWRLLAAGFTPVECATVRGMEEDVVLDHALRAVEAGWQVQAAWFLSPELTATLESVIGPTDPQRIRPLLSRLPPGTRYGHVQWFLACRKAAAQ
jgi:hypothetical protein